MFVYVDMTAVVDVRWRGMMLQGMRKLGLGVVNEVASERFAYARFTCCGLGLWNPAGHPLTCQAVPAPQHAREAEARRTRGMHEAEQCVGSGGF